MPVSRQKESQGRRTRGLLGLSSWRMTAPGEEAVATAKIEACARQHLPELLAKTQYSPADVGQIAIPGTGGTLTPPSQERREIFRMKVVAATQASHAEEALGGDPKREELPILGNYDAACGVCWGACCSYGGNAAFINGATVRRLRNARPELTDAEIVEHYVNAIPELTVESSCILHGQQGCALPREQRSSICNDFWCRPVKDWQRKEVKREAARPVAMMIVHDDRVIRSAIVAIDPKAPL
jgi:hypothetical protein